MTARTIKFKRGTDAKRQAYTLKLGEPVWTTDTHELWIGDSQTLGGIPIGVKVNGSVTAGTIQDGMVVLLDGTTGKFLKGITKSEFLQDTITMDNVETRLDELFTDEKANVALVAETALNANKLSDKTIDQFITSDNLSDNPLENDGTKAASTIATKTLADTIGNAVLNSQISQYLYENSPTKVPSSYVMNVLNTFVQELANRVTALEQQP